VKVIEAAPTPFPVRWNRLRSTEQPPQIVIDIRRDKASEFFEIRTAPGSRQEIDILNLQPREKHLVLLSRQFDVQGELSAKQKFLCGREEKHWFVAAIPENEPVNTVIGAKIARKPEEVRTREQALGVLGISAEEYKRLAERERKLGFTMMKGDAAVYVRGEVRHPDHETITLNGWHRVLMNTENRSSALRYLAFLD
jgi:hypothetical protein